ncbi:MAG: hypothetical protein VYB71_00015 [Chloroflexota bacterium]|nr:hypothetical protein [Chloroflexota bacterium]MEE2655960.1 hypothetical protein [Chloroflexota bacterium]
MIREFMRTVRGLAPPAEFEGYLCNLLDGNSGEHTPTIEEARKQYRVMVNERSGLIDRF